MKKLTLFIFALILIPSMAMAWQGKVVAVDSPTTFIVLKEGQTPVKIQLADAKLAEGVHESKARLKASSIALMRDVEVNEKGSTADSITTADIMIGENSLAQELIDDGALQSTLPPVENSVEPVAEKMQTPANTTAASSTDANNEQGEELIADPAQLQEEDLQQNLKQDETVASDITSEEMVSRLVPTPEQTSQKTAAPVLAEEQISSQPSVQKINPPSRQVSQPLGFWPARPVQVQSAPITEISQPLSYQKSDYAKNEPKAQGHPNSEAKQAGVIAKEDYELAVRVQRRTKRVKRKGAFAPKRNSETFVGGSFGAQGFTKPESRVAYSTIGKSGGASIRHFFPSGFGLGADIMMSRVDGKSGAYGGTNATNGTVYDYKNKDFDTYTFTASLLYRFYADRNWIPYIAVHGGYSLFSFPDTVFNISQGVPVAGGGAGFLYRFDSGFTIGTDLRYMKTLGTQSGDPEGVFGSTLNFGYTFD